MTLSFKDPNGVECRLLVSCYNSAESRIRERPAALSDLLSALGQLSTGSDGPTGEELRAVRRCISAASKNETVTDSTLSDALRAADRVDALFAAGFASRQAEVDRLTAELADEKRHSRNQRGELNRFNRQVRADYEAMPLRHQLESELTATRAKLAEVERSRDLHSQERQRLDRKEYELLAEIDELTHELASARRALEAVNATLEKGPRYTDRHMEAAADAVADEIREAMALASAGTDADRTGAAKCSPFCVNPWCPNRCWPPAATEPPRAEAGEPRCEHCNMREHAYSKGGRCPLGPSGRHSFDEPPAESKPEPRCTYWRPGWERRCGLVTDGADLCPAHLMLSTRKFGLNVRPEETNVDIPRRDRIDQMTPAELAIRAAVEAVERVGAHPLLTDAVNLLHEAQGRVADYVDTTEEPKPEPQPSACFTFAVGDTVRILNGDDPRTGKTADVIGLYPKECATLRVHGEPPPRAPDVYPAYPLTCLEPVEPQPSGFALPWHVEHVRSIRDERGQPVVSSVLDADGKRVASLVTPERAAFIVARCNGSPQRQPHVESSESGKGEQRR